MPLGPRELSWLTPLGTVLARAAEKAQRPAKSVIVLWMGGGPSQLETFDPKPGAGIAASTKAINTAVKGVQLAAGLEQLADQMAHVLACPLALEARKGTTSAARTT